MSNKEMSVEDSFNLLVNICRQQKLTFEEHQTVSQAIEILLKELNKDQEPESNQKTNKN
tara:strand:+ start:188 stop:364 length:177 start_codon:yes stop_codon:yes gene_type:complete